MKQLRLTVLAFLGLTSFVKSADGNEQLTEEQKAKMLKAFGADFTGDFTSAIEREGKGEVLDAALALGFGRWNEHGLDPETQAQP